MEIPMQEPTGVRLKGRRPRVSNSVSTAGSRLRNKLAVGPFKGQLATRVILFGLLISCAGLLWLNQTSTIVALGYDTQNIDKKITQLNRQAEILQSQIAAFENPQRVEEEAKSKLGMVPATKFVYEKVQPTASQTEAGTNNPKLYPVNDWWRELTEMLPKPWQNSAPTQH
jgi:cell division protein FtsL